MSKKLADSNSISYCYAGKIKMLYADKARQVDLWIANVSISFLGLTRTMKICIVEHSEEPLFGLDLLELFKVTMDMKKRIIRSKKTNYRIKVKLQQCVPMMMKLSFLTEENLSKDKGRTSFFRRVLKNNSKDKNLIISATEDYTVPPRSTVHIGVEYNFATQEPHAINTSMSKFIKEQVMVPRGVVTSDVLTLPLTNFGTRKIKIKQNSRIAFGQRCSDEPLETKEDDNDINLKKNWMSFVVNDVLSGSNKALENYPRCYIKDSKDCEAVLRLAKQKATAIDEAESEEIDPLDKTDMKHYSINSKLNNEQKLMIEDIIKSNIDMFAFSNSDCFSDKSKRLPQLRIRTGDATPILQRAYLFGYKPRDPLVNFIGTSDFYPQSWFDEIPSDLAQRLENTRKQALDNLLKHAENIERKTTPKRLVPLYTVGQKVLRLLPLKPQNTVKGFWKPWDGPFEIVKVISPIIYRIKRCNEHSDEQTVNVENLRAYDSREEHRYIEYSQDLKNRFDFARKNFREKTNQTDLNIEMSELEKAEDQPNIPKALMPTLNDEIRTILSIPSENALKPLQSILQQLPRSKHQSEKHVTFMIENSGIETEAEHNDTKHSI
ncbi:hypothetical protein HDE_04004 [Halotydeus destructor]|nr:hypothetical protein HDE_04004 [Halotydeus destructor]